MAEVIELARHRAQRASPVDAPRTGRPTLYFDLASPFTYLVAERAERRLGAARWRPASLPAGLERAGEEVARTAAERAHALGMPLVWPERFPARVPSAMRVAAYADELGRGPAFAIAAGRLAFCGGFDLEDCAILAEAAAAAGIEVDRALAAAADVRRDRAITAAAQVVVRAGATALPALRHGRRLYCGEEQISAWLVHGGGEVARPSAS